MDTREGSSLSVLSPRTRGWREPLAPTCLVSLLVVSLASGVWASSAQSGGSLAVSSPTQTIEDYGREWRRARKMTRACRAPEEVMRRVSFMEGVLIAGKVEEEKKLGRPVGAPRSYVLGFQDYLDVTVPNCRKHLEAMTPIMKAFYEDVAGPGAPKLLRAPPVACPGDHPC